MSNSDMPPVARYSVPAGVVVTRWWWVRHAPVRSEGGNIYGQNDMDCDCSDRLVFNALGKILPHHAVWVASKLRRAHQTAAAIWAAGFPKPDSMRHESDFNEQHLGDWQGLNRAAFFAGRPAIGNHWFAPIDVRSPNGESFMDLYNRTKAGVDRINAQHPGRDIIAIAHSGTIKAAIGLALDHQPERGLAFIVDNCSVTRLDHHAIEGRSCWRIPMVNQQPWIAGAARGAMHQPTGPEIAGATEPA